MFNKKYYICNRRTWYNNAVSDALYDELEDISVVSMDVNVKGQEGAKIALVGPTRMDYAKVISVMKYISKKLNEKFYDDE